MKILSIVVLLAATNASAQLIERINPEGMTQPTAYSHLVKYDNLMFIAGQVALDEQGNVVGEGDMAAQFRQVLENLKTVLASEGADFSNIVKINIFTTDVDGLRQHMAVRSEYFGDYAPASTLVQIDRLARPVFLLEIEAIAIKPH
jgi:2-iminobutanoate/2-iminopropanoate deaminase